MELVAKLRDVEQQLSRVVASAQLRLQTPTAAPEGAKGLASSTAEADALIASIDRLQRELLAFTTQVKQQLQANATQVTTECEAVDAKVRADSETETEDEDIQFESAGQKREHEENGEEQQPPAKRAATDAGGVNVVPKVEESLHEVMLRYLEATRAALEAANGSRELKQPTNLLASVLGRTRFTTAKLLDALQGANPVDDETATMFRDAVVLLPVIISAECAQSRIPRKGLIRKATTCIEQVLDFADKKEGTGTPVALLDPLLRSSYIKLQEYFQEHCTDTLDELQAFVRANPARKNVLGDQIRDPFNTLLHDFQREFRSFGYKERSSVVKRSEERWRLFADIATVLADWIGIVLSTPKPLPVPSSKKFAYQLKSFAKQYSGRVPPLLLRYVTRRVDVGMCCRSLCVYTVRRG
ncbi:hypothetical protein BBJ28_00021985 [Nothophytophthora sp. Chile5]|nr:hypothetical protein BBJ28_00021985 [Nothophytophthora sp. Chile5]